MKGINSIIVLFLMLILINGCKKEKDKPLDTEIDFIIGTENDFVDITKFDSTIKIIATSYNSINVDFDIDKDGIPDFKIRSDYETSPGGINYQKSSIKVVNSLFQISTIDMFDTLHKCTQITNDTIITYIIYNNYSTYTCNGDGIDSTYSPNIFSIPKIYSMGDRLTYNEFWSSEDLIFSYYDQSYQWVYPPYISYSVIRGNWNNQNMKYILFRKENNNKSLYGWLRLSIDNYREIRVYEYAIQKE